MLNHPHQANFSQIQKRSRMKNKDRIDEAASRRPASFMAFDLLLEAGSSLTRIPLEKRKQRLATVFGNTGQLGERIHFVPFSKDADAAWDKLFRYKGEGLVAKRNSSLYGNGKKHQDWFKIKNWRTITAVLPFYDPKNEYFTACVFQDDEVVEIGKCKHGLDEEAFRTLRELFFTNGKNEQGGYRLPPAVCASIHTLDPVAGEIREPSFSQLLPEMDVAACTSAKLKLDLAMLPDSVDVSNTDKVFWPEADMTKGDLLAYMREIAPYMLPFLKNRLLTIIRSPDGVSGESFFQKHLPDYAPDFLEGVVRDEETHFVCNNLDALIWLANHGTMEYHIPFQTVTDDKPAEIVFDLDPPGREAFQLAVKAARLLKQLLDDLELMSFVKTSGGKGLQVHIPIPAGSMTYEETGIFTEAIALTLEHGYPDLFTTERFKNKRGGRLYIDYLQHGKDKTLIAPYSPRKREDATVAAPLYWEEVDEDLHPSAFTINNVVERVQTHGCPFAEYATAGEQQKMDKLLGMIQDE